MKQLLLFALFLALPALASAQCFTGYRDAGKAHVQKKEYDKAIEKFNKAKGCKSDKPANGDKEINALIADVKKRQAPPPPKPATPSNQKPSNQKPSNPKPAGPTAAQQQAAAAARADDDAWDIAQGTLTGCKRYLAKYPSGRHVAAARQCERDYSDDDSDGILNKDDRCPKEKGTTAYDGCPPPKPTPVPVATDPTKCADCPEMVSVTGGSFTMGCKSSTRDGECYDDEKPPHEVTVRDFYIGKYEVTQAEWRREMGSNPSGFKDCDNCPVENVSWNDVQEFIKKLNARTGKRYRLPTEAEWEYAARGGSRSQGYLYSGSNTLADVGWFSDNSGSKTKPVGTRKANELGIYDMSGNVWEWVEDDWHGNYTNAPTDGRAWVDSGRGSRRVGRGGSWNRGARHCRVSNRDSSTPDGRGDNLGFRLASSPQ